MSAARWLTCLWGILVREVLRFLNQRERFLAALERDEFIWKHSLR